MTSWGGCVKPLTCRQWTSWGWGRAWASVRICVLIRFVGKFVTRSAYRMPTRFMCLLFLLLFCCCCIYFATTSVEVFLHSKLVEAGKSFKCLPVYTHTNIFVCSCGCWVENFLSIQQLNFWLTTQYLLNSELLHFNSLLVCLWGRNMNASWQFIWNGCSDPTMRGLQWLSTQGAIVCNCSPSWGYCQGLAHNMMQRFKDFKQTTMLARIITLCLSGARLLAARLTAFVHIICRPSINPKVRTQRRKFVFCTRAYKNIRCSAGVRRREKGRFIEAERCFIEIHVGCKWCIKSLFACVCAEAHSRWRFIVSSFNGMFKRLRLCFVTKQKSLTYHFTCIYMKSSYEELYTLILTHNLVQFHTQIYTY